MALRINISERDLTQSVQALSNTDIVFVPGLSSVTTVEQYAPVTCTTLSEFTSTFGSYPVLFNAAMPYSAFGEGHGFAEAAVPTTGNLFDANSPDPSWIYAAKLLSQGLQVIYCKINTDAQITDGKFTGTATNLYSQLSAVFASATTNLTSKGDFDFKYLTSGGYPVFEYESNSIVTDMLSICATRGDAVALIDHTDNPERKLSVSDQTSVAYVLNNTYSNSFTNGAYGAMFTPWAVYPQTVYQNDDFSSFNLPGSFAYLTSLAQSLQTNYNWAVVAGVSRGLVPGLIELHTNDVLTNAIADGYQNFGNGTSLNGLYINGITRIKPYGFCIWGNRTLRQNGTLGLQAMSYLNLRNLTCDVKKQVYTACINLLYEQNTATLWTNFKSYLTPLLDQMVSGSGISGYRIIRNVSDSPTKISASIRIYPIYAVESFDITVYMTDDDVTVA